MNCWEFKLCGREAAGVNSGELGVCPAYPDNGKQCAMVVGTLCGGQVQGTYAKKLSGCQECAFYNSEHYLRHLSWMKSGVKKMLEQRENI